MSIKFKARTNHPQGWLRFRQKLVLSEAVVALMDWSRTMGYRCYVSFGTDKIPEVLIQKVKNE